MTGKEKKLNDTIVKLENRLTELYAKRAGRHIVADWHWSQDGRKPVFVSEGN
jgi:hypothetical protein